MIIRSHDRLIFIMKIPKPGKTLLYWDGALVVSSADGWITIDWLLYRAIYWIHFCRCNMDRCKLVYNSIFCRVKIWCNTLIALRWRHNDQAGVSNHQPHGCLLNRLFRRKSKKTSKLRITGLCVGNSPGTGEFLAQMASYAENVSIWWRHHGFYVVHNMYIVWVPRLRMWVPGLHLMCHILLMNDRNEDTRSHTHFLENYSQRKCAVT